MKESLIYAIVEFLAQKWIIIADFIILIWLSLLMQRKPDHITGFAIWTSIIANAALCSVVSVSSRSGIGNHVVSIAASGISWFLVQEFQPCFFKCLFTLLILKISMQILVLRWINKLDIRERLLFCIYIAILSCLRNHPFLFPLWAQYITKARWFTSNSWQVVRIVVKLIFFIALKLLNQIGVCKSNTPQVLVVCHPVEGLEWIVAHIRAPLFLLDGWWGELGLWHLFLAGLL